MNGSDPNLLFAILGLSYLLGSIPTAVLVCRAMGLGDPRQQGSGNPGTTNVLRMGKYSAALVTLLGDSGKGVLAVLIARWLDLSVIEQAMAGIAVLAGHVWSLFLRFRGGKGVATMIGVCLALDYHLGLLQCFFWLSLIAIRKISSLAGIGMALISPLCCWLIQPALIAPVTLMSGLIIATHHQNIRKLIAGRESKL